MFFQASWRIWY